MSRKGETTSPVDPQRVIALRAAGKTFGQIALILTHEQPPSQRRPITKSAVIGKLRRSGLTDPHLEAGISPIKRVEKPKKEAPQRRRAVLDEAPPAPSRGQRRALALPAGATGVAAATRPPAALPALPPPAAEAPRPSAPCQWVIGEPSADDSCKCGRPVAEAERNGRRIPYCAEHLARAYVPAARAAAMRRAWALRKAQQGPAPQRPRRRRHGRPTWSRLGASEG